MRKETSPILFGALVWSVLSCGQAIADDDACQMFLCMSGKVQGNGEASGCSGSISDYFAIQVWDPTFDPNATASLRNERIGQCNGIVLDASGRNAELQQLINIAYGRLPYDL